MEIIHNNHLIYMMSAENKPVTAVESGSVLIFETCDCFEDQITNQYIKFDKLDWDRINPATGPVYINQADPGDILAVEIQHIEISDQAVMITAPELGVIGDMLKKPQINIIPINDGMADMSGIQVPLNPMIGVIGTAPAGNKSIPCGIPDAHGGNMDCKIITVGTTLYLPVNVPGALLAIGDLHAAMGDGEVSVCGLEIAGKVRVKVNVIKDHILIPPMMQTKDAIYTIASAPLLDDAANKATRNMVNFIATSTNLSFADTISLLSIAGNLQICQIVDPQKTCRYELPMSIANQLGIKI